MSVAHIAIFANSTFDSVSKRKLGIRGGGPYSAVAPGKGKLWQKSAE